MGARVVHRYVLRQIDSERLRVHFVWLDILDADSRAAAQNAANRIQDARVTHYWVPDDAMTRQFADVLGMEDGARAWDVFLLYDEDAFWGPDALPRPDRYMYQNLPLAKERLLDARELAEEVRALLSTPR